MKLPLTVLAFSFLASLGLLPAAAVEVGARAPAPAAIDERGRPFQLAEVYRRGLTLIFFFPKADTPGCTAQACSLRDSFAGLKGRGVQIVGVSADQPDAQTKFREKYSLPFPLIADADGAVAKAFGVPTFLGFTKRQSFLIQDGKVVWRDLSVSPKTHLSKVNDALDALK